MSLRVIPSITNSSKFFVRAMSTGYGDGAGKGGGGGGSIRSAGGAFGKMEAAREDEYFYKKQKAQLEDLKDEIQKEIDHHRQSVERHEQRLKEVHQALDKTSKK